jgi:hypothetical protein
MDQNLAAQAVKVQIPVLPYLGHRLPGHHKALSSKQSTHSQFLWRCGEMKRFLKIAVPVACAVAMCGSVLLWRAYNEKANQQRLVEAANVTRLGAEQGDAKAQYSLGHMYYHGQGVPQNYAEAVSWYRKSADQGDAKGQYGLGYMYYHGQGVPQDRALANHWFHKAANQGYENAQRTLSVELTLWRKLFLLTQVVGGILLMVWSFRQKSRWNPRTLVLSLTGILCLFTAALSWYGYIHHLIWYVNSGFSAFTWFKWLLDVVSIALLVYIVQSGKKSAGQASL